MCRFSSIILIFLTFLTSVSLLAERRYFNDLKLGSDFQKGLEKLLDGNQSVSLSDLKKTTHTKAFEGCAWRDSNPLRFTQQTL